MSICEKIMRFVSEVKPDFKPFYIYDLEHIKENCNDFIEIKYKNKAIHFATMANINEQFLKIIRASGVNVFVNSLLHLETVMKAGFESDEIIFTASAMSKETMQKVYLNNVQLNLDSPAQLKLWLSLYPNQAVGIRCNIGDKIKPYETHAGYFLGKESRLGFTIEELELIEDKSKIKGLHVYVGTDIVDIEYFIGCYEQLANLVELFPSLEYLNFGGGFGINEDGDKQFDFVAYNERLTELMDKTSQRYGRSIKLILEPGRIIGGKAGFFVSHVTDVKKRDEIIFVGLNASTVQFPRPLMYPEDAKHPIFILRDGELITSDAVYKTVVYGASTYSRDIFRKDVLLPEVKIGDVVLIGNAGSYSGSSYTQFLGFPKPEEFFI